jgi:hypothetical protein
MIDKNDMQFSISEQCSLLGMVPLARVSDACNCQRVSKRAI